MKILFIQDQEFMFLGVLSLFGSLNAAGRHECDVLIDSVESDILCKIREIAPDIIGFSILSNDYQWFKTRVAEVKTAFPRIPVIVGGIHTLLQNDLIENPYIDITCNGDGEHVLRQLLDAMEDGKDYSGIPGTNVKKESAIQYNGIAPLQLDLDAFIDDREIYMRRYPQFRRDSVLQIISSRGCPLQCSFCMNERSHELYSRAVYRFKSIDTIMKELRHMLEYQRDPAIIYFVDDLFLAHKKRFIELAARVKDELGIPFMGGGLPNAIDENIARVMAATGFQTFCTGLETANDDHRRRIFNKNTWTGEYRTAAAVLHRHGVKVYTTSLFVYPEQTVEDVLATAAFNIDIQSDYTFSALLLPYPGTAIERFAREKGMLPEKWDFDTVPKTYFEEAVLNIPEKEIILRLYRIFYFLVRWPWLFAVVRRLPRWVRYIPCTRYIHYLGLFLWFKNWRQLGFWECLRYFWRFRKNH